MKFYCLLRQVCCLETILLVKQICACNKVNLMARREGQPRPDYIVVIAVLRTDPNVLNPHLGGGDMSASVLPLATLVQERPTRFSGTRDTMVIMITIVP